MAVAGGMKASWVTIRMVAFRSRLRDSEALQEHAAALGVQRAGGLFGQYQRGGW